MPRGRLLSSKVKEEKALTKARIETEFKTTAKMKATTQGFLVSARDHIGRMIDNIDPLDAIAIGSLTLVVKTQILSNPGLLAQWKNILSVAEEVVTEPWRVWLSGMLGYFGLGFLAYAQPSQVTTAPDMEAWMKDNEFYLWLMSFIIAFMLVKYGGEIIAGLGSGVKGMASLIGLFL